MPACVGCGQPLTHVSDPLCAACRQKLSGRMMPSRPRKKSELSQVTLGTLVRFTNYRWWWTNEIPPEGIHRLIEARRLGWETEKIDVPGSRFWMPFDHTRIVFDADGFTVYDGPDENYHLVRYEWILDNDASILIHPDDTANKEDS